MNWYSPMPPQVTMPRFMAWFVAIFVAGIFSGTAAVVLGFGGFGVITLLSFYNWTRQKEPLANRAADVLHLAAFVTVVASLIFFNLSQTGFLAVLVVAVGGSTALSTLIVNVWGAPRHGKLTEDEKTTFAHEPGSAK